ncbi:MAG: C25 family cysteine peptidase [Planctomycetota bacterium]
MRALPLFAALLLATTARAQDLIVVTPKAFRPALTKWRQHRTQQGHEIGVLDPRPDMKGLLKAAHAKSGGKLRFVLLVGDAHYVPPSFHKGEIIAPWERDPRIANDNAMADLDGDHLPDLAVGRVPADNPEEAATVLAKVLEYEGNQDFSDWRRRINVVAGVGGFGKFQDWAIEQVATKFLSENVPLAYDLHVTYGNPNSAFCPPPSEMLGTTLERFNEGALLVAYLGHGSRLSLDRIRFKNRSYPILDEDSAWSLESRRGAPIVLFSACSTGHFDGAPDSLAEVALKQPKGPVAIIAASRVSMPYGNGVLAKEMLEAIFRERLPTLGEMMVRAKRRTMRPKENDPGRQFIEALALGYQWDAKKREQERVEHLFLYNLLGDPATRIPLPDAMEIECAEEIEPGGRLTIVGVSPVQGEARFELVAPRRADMPPRKGDRPEDFRVAYERANSRTRAETTLRAAKGRVEAQLELPSDLPLGDYFVRVYVSGAEGAAVGARVVKVRAERKQ